MSDISITAANVKPSTTSLIRIEIAAASINIGGPVAFLENVGFVQDDADLNDGRVYQGIALNSVAAGQALMILDGDPEFAVGGTTAQGEVYCVSGSGGICPEDDIVAGQIKKVIAIGLAGNKLKLQRSTDILTGEMPEE